MNEIIKISTADSRFPVDARELHEKLQVQSRFNDWIGNRIRGYDLIDGIDYQSYTKILVNGGKATEYSLSMNCAISLAMVENNEMGKRIRRYFIEVEKRTREGLFYNVGLVVRIDGGEPWYNYREVLTTMGLSQRSGSVSRRIRNNRTEFRRLDGVWYVSHAFAMLMGKDIELRKQHIAVKDKQRAAIEAWNRRQFELQFTC
jgi:phage anti-repressor protein